MKKDNTFLLLSLEEEKAKKLSKVISSDTCRKILNFLANRDATETELSTELAIPISTVDYNLTQLLEAGLVKALEFHYSAKGKEVNHYSLANKYIIIAPKTTESLANRLKKFLPVAAIVALTGAAIQYFGRTGAIANDNSLKATAEGTQMLAAAAPRAAPIAVHSANALQWQVAALFVLGGLFALFVYAVYNYLLSKK